MLESLPVMLTVGTALGFLAGLGIGGGSLLILWLTMALGMDQQTARGINLMFFLPAAVIAAFFRWKQGTVNPRRILPAAIAGCVSALIFSYIGQQIDIAFAKKLFGGLLIVTGIKELFYRNKK